MILNISEHLPLIQKMLSFDVQVFLGRSVVGFGCSHVQAFWRIQDEFLCVIHPDVSIELELFAMLLRPKFMFGCIDNSFGGQ